MSALLDGHWYDAVAGLLDTALARPDPSFGLGEMRDLTRARNLAMAARRVLDLDGEDFGEIAAGFDTAWASRLAASGFPAEPRARERGALGSLVPIYELMLEVLDLRAIRREPLQVVVTAHLIGEYLPQLAWESTLGHAGDPLLLEDVVGGSRWGVTDRPLEERRDLDARVRLAKLYVESPVVALRHHAPVGHFFGVPSTAEISEAWLRTWEKLATPWNDGANPLLTTPAPAAAVHEALPGMAALVSAVAGRPLGPGRLLRDIGDDVARALEATDVEVVG